MLIVSTSVLCRVIRWQSCADGHEELVRVLLTEFRADVHRADHERWTPLHTAALGRRPAICRLLIDQ